MLKGLEELVQRLTEEPQLMNKIQHLFDSAQNASDWFDKSITLRMEVLPLLLGQDASKFLLDYIYDGEPELTEENCPDQTIKEFLQLCASLYEPLVAQTAAYLVDPFGVFRLRTNIPFEDRYVITILRNDGESLALQFTLDRLQWLIDALTDEHRRFKDWLERKEAEKE